MIIRSRTEVGSTCHFVWMAVDHSYLFELFFILMLVYTTCVQCKQFTLNMLFSLKCRMVLKSRTFQMSLRFFVRVHRIEIHVRTPVFKFTKFTYARTHARTRKHAHTHARAHTLSLPPKPIMTKIPVSHDTA